MAITTDFNQRRSASSKENGFVIDGQDFANTATLALDGARSRPRYFDGRFLTGKDLSRDQDYVRQRQDDLARASGTGVIAGLHVTQETATDISIADGFGVTASGDLVAISSPLKLSLANVAEMERLNASFGIRVEPAAPFSKRTGLFILALRPVEYTSNRIAAYPTSVTGQRHMEDGDIIEATAVTLIGFPVGGDANNLRAAAARQIFFDASMRGVPVEALPLALIALNQGAIQWIDVNMVRRENLGSSTLQSALGSRSRALAEAHVLQYQEQLQFITRGSGKAFAAASAFSILPPVGQMPLACLSHDGFGFKESFFPPGLSVDVSFIPTDEIAALVEESLPLPPVDLSAPAASLAGTGVVILIPLPRSELKNAVTAFGATGIRQATPVPQINFWMENLHALNAIRLATEEPQTDPHAGNWQKFQALAEKHGNGFVWFAKRRSIALRSSLEGRAQAANKLNQLLMRVGVGGALKIPPKDGPPTTETGVTPQPVGPQPTPPDVVVVADPAPPTDRVVIADPAPLTTDTLVRPDTRPNPDPRVAPDPRVRPDPRVTVDPRAAIDPAILRDVPVSPTGFGVRPRPLPDTAVIPGRIVVPRPNP